MLRFRIEYDDGSCDILTTESTQQAVQQSEVLATLYNTTVRSRKMLLPIRGLDALISERRRT